jgi:hypothetical protein
MFVNKPKPGFLPASISASDGDHSPVMTSWHGGAPVECGVIQNQSAALNESTGSVANISGWFNNLRANAYPHLP